MEQKVKYCKIGDKVTWEDEEGFQSGTITGEYKNISGDMIIGSMNYILYGDLYVEVHS